MTELLVELFPVRYGRGWTRVAGIMRIGVVVIGVVVLGPHLALAMEHVDRDGAADMLDAAEEVELDEGKLEITAPHELRMYREAYVAKAEDVTAEEITEWETARIDASTFPPGQVWDGDFREGEVLFREQGTLHFARFFDPGAYYVFLWGCETRTEEDRKVPGGCRWLDPRYVTMEEDEEIPATDLAVTYRGERYEYNEDAMGEDGSDHDWVVNGEETDLVVEQHDYILIHPVQDGELSFDEVDGNPYGPTYNNQGDKALLWQVDKSDRLGIRQVAGGDVSAEIRVEDCGDQSWNGEECRDMYDVVAVPMNYNQEEFKEYFKEMDDVAFGWAEQYSPLRHDYEDPRDVMKLWFLEPEDEYPMVEDLDIFEDEHVPDVEDIDGEQIKLSDPHTDICWAPGPAKWCVKVPKLSCVAQFGEWSLDQAAETAAQDSRYSDRYDDVVAMHKGEMQMWDMVEQVPEDIEERFREGEEPDMVDAIGVFRSGYDGCGKPGRAVVISSEADMPERTLGHELGHAMGICRTEGVDYQGVCEPGLDINNYHVNVPGPFCLNAVKQSGDRDIMNYCENRDDRYWGDPDVGGDPDDMELPYANVRQWMRHHIEGEEPPREVGVTAVERNLAERFGVAAGTSALVYGANRAIDVIWDEIASDPVTDAIDWVRDGIDSILGGGDGDDTEESRVCSGTPDAPCFRFSRREYGEDAEAICEAMGCAYQAGACVDRMDAPEEDSCSAMAGVLDDPEEKQALCEETEGCQWEPSGEAPPGRVR